MKPTELRIGNLILSPDGIVTVVHRIDGQNELQELGYKGSVTIEVYLQTSGKIFGYHGVWLDKCSPIPLTEEWLIKFGFQKVEKEDNFDNINLKYWAKDGLLLFFNDSPPYNTYLAGWGCMRNGKYYVATGQWIDTVHQLQNQYHAFRGTELELK